MKALISVAAHTTKIILSRNRDYMEKFCTFVILICKKKKKKKTMPKKKRKKKKRFSFDSPLCVAEPLRNKRFSRVPCFPKMFPLQSIHPSIFFHLVEAEMPRPPSPWPPTPAPPWGFPGTPRPDEIYSLHLVQMDLNR